MRFWKIVTSLAVCSIFVVFQGCTKPQMILDRAIIFNASGKKITEVKAFHEPTRVSGQVNAILPRDTLEIGFSKRPLRARQVTVSWRDGNGVKRQATLELPYDYDAAWEGRTMVMIYEIHSNGEVSAYLKTAE